MLTDKYKNFLSYHIYQVYPRSFLDTNGDGIGDLNGVTEKLDYLKDLGINAIWLCPCYKSPNEDNGYDVADYRQIMEEFGTMEDIKVLISQMHKRDMKLIMDLVPNHTSKDHVWFQESRKGKDNPYSDFYYWFDTPPNNWQSMFGGSAYAYDETRGQYYLHTYAKGQPDLNWENPRVVEEMLAVIDFWVDMGVDGFRVDVIDQISKNFNGENCFGPRLHEFIHAMFGREKTKHLFTVGECWANDIDEVIRHCAPDRGELSTLFQFDHTDVGRAEKFEKKPMGLKTYWSRISRWEKQMQEYDLLYSLFTDNHDQGRLISRIGNDRELRYESATCLAAMTFLLRGVCFIYQGQEFGMTDSHHDSIEDFRDVESLQMYDILCQTRASEEALEMINFGSRDNPRRPMCWNGDRNGGFTEATPWMPVHSRYQEVNLEADLASDKSVYRFFRKMLHLRLENPALTVGSFEEVSGKNDNFCAFTRWEGDAKILVICNFEQKQTISLATAGYELLLSNYGMLEKDNRKFEPYEVAVFRID